jgi:hypothetical protein
MNGNARDRGRFFFGRRLPNPASRKARGHPVPGPPIRRVPEHGKGKKTRAAGLPGITRLTLRDKLKQYELVAFFDGGD